MKKLVVILAVLMMMVASVAYATEAPLAAVPSKTSNDVTKVEDKTGTIVKAEPSVEAVAELEKVIEFAKAQPDAPVIEYFGEAVKTQIAAALPNVDEKALEMNEFVTIATAPTAEVVADAEVEFEFATVYTAKQAIVALVGIFNGAEVEWVAQDATVLDSGKVSVHFTKDVLEKMSKATSVSLAILSVSAES